ncbi:hypothetical protein MPTA6512_5560 [Mycoplasmoides pneumoniae]
MTGVEPLDSTKAGKGKSSTEWKTEETNAKSDAPLANGQQVGGWKCFWFTRQWLEQFGVKTALEAHRPN